jgi:hypothetical protein
MGKARRVPHGGVADGAEPRKNIGHERASRPRIAAGVLE